MYIATIIPIARGIPFDTLTYYAPEALPTGTLVTAPFGKQTIYGFVTDSVSLTEAKTFVKKAAFSLKKINTVLGTSSSFASLTHSLKETGTACMAPVGAVAASVIPSTMFDYLVPEKTLPFLFTKKEFVSSFEERSVIGTRSERVDEYKRIIRSAFAKKESVLFVAPTIRSLEWWKQQLEKGIGRHVLCFHSKVTKKTLRSQFSQLKQSTLPVVLFTTPGFCTIPCPSLGLLCVEDESSNLYRSNDRYEIDTRLFIKEYARQQQLPLIWGDTLPRFETLYRTQATHLPRTFIPEKLRVVPIEPYRTILPSEVIELVRHTQKKKKRLFIYTNRKGVAPLSRCADCGTIVQCPDCDLPMALRNRIRNGERERFFTCLHCGSIRDASHTCTYCAGWNIVPVAIGTESVRDAVTSIIEAEHVVTIDDDLTPDNKTVETLLEEVSKKKVAVIIGTQKVLPFLKKIDYTIVPFFDRFLSTPSLYTTEQVLRLVMECNEQTTEAVILCTRTPEFPLTRQLETQKINAIIHDELELRKQLGYPPFGTLLKISITVPEGYRTTITEQLEKYFLEQEHIRLPARQVSHGSMKVLLSWLIKVNATYIEEEGQELTLFMEHLRFPFKIEQNPERI